MRSLLLPAILSLAFCLAQNTTPSQPFTVSAPNCTGRTRCQPNPIANDYPSPDFGTGTGTVNGTIAIIPIDYAVARSIVPAQFPILKKAYRKLFPALPADKYPMYITMIHDHDLRVNGQPAAPDFSRASLVFPFIDRLNNGYSTFRWGGPLLVTPNPIVQAGSSNRAFLGTFDPPCDAYSFVPGEERPRKTYMNAWVGNDEALGRPPSFQTSFRPSIVSPYAMTVYPNITNQPIFNNLTIDDCDHFVQLYNTTLSTGKNKPVTVIGDVTVRPPFFPTEQTWRGVFGLRLDGAFVDDVSRSCSSLAGFTEIPENRWW